MEKDREAAAGKVIAAAGHGRRVRAAGTRQSEATEAMDSATMPSATLLCTNTSYDTSPNEDGEREQELAAKGDKGKSLEKAMAAPVLEAKAGRHKALTVPEGMPAEHWVEEAERIYRDVAARNAITQEACSVCKGLFVDLYGVGGEAAMEGLDGVNRPSKDEDEDSNAPISELEWLCWVQEKAIEGGALEGYRSVAGVLQRLRGNLA